MAIRKTNTSQQKAMKMALDFITINITNKQALRECYGMGAVILSKIEAEKPLFTSTFEKYMKMFVSIINDYRCRYREDSPRRKMAKDFLSDMILVLFEIKDDAEKRA